MKTGTYRATLAIAGVLALGGCGGGGGGADAPLGSEDPADIAPDPRGSVDQAADQLVRAIESGDCRQLFAIARHSTKRSPELSGANAPPSKEECTNLERYAKQLKGFEVNGASRVFHSAALVDGRVKNSPVTTIFVLDLDGSWKVAVTSGSDPQVGSKPVPDNEFDDNVAKFVEAARDGDCAETFRLMGPDSDVVEALGSTRERFCKELPQASRHPRSFFSRVKKDEDAKPVALGKTREFAFYGLVVDPGIYYTLVASRQPERLPVTPRHERDAVYAWYLAKE